MRFNLHLLVNTELTLVGVPQASLDLALRGTRDPRFCALAVTAGFGCSSRATWTFDRLPCYGV